MDDLQAASQLIGFQWPSPAYLIGMLVFSLVGIVAFRYGKKTDHRLTLWLGVALMFYPYVVSATWLLYVVGFALCAGIWYDHR
jgi:hypothetical protein